MLDSGSGSKASAALPLLGQVAVVTGGNGGIGLGMARGLLAAGADVAIWGRDEAKNERAAESFGDRRRLHDLLKPVGPAGSAHRAAVLNGAPWQSGGRPEC